LASVRGFGAGDDADNLAVEIEPPGTGAHVAQIAVGSGVAPQRALEVGDCDDALGDRRPANLDQVFVDADF
jgi:hypothetical protein